MRLEPLGSETYAKRISRLQSILAEEELDVFIGYSSECESATSRYLSGFWPFFDFDCVVVPAEGEAVLVTGGPESYDFAKRFSGIKAIRINPLLVETSAPDWVPEVKGESFQHILPDVCGRVPRRVGVGNWNIFPHVLFEDLKKGAPGAEYIPADDLLLRIQMIKEKEEIPFVIETYRITEEAMKTALESVEPGMREWELESIARRKMLELGAEGMPYPAWVCSGPNTPLSLCRSTDRKIEKNELVQFTFGTKYMGYCGNMCRPFAIGSIPSGAGKLIDVALEAMDYALGAIRPGVVSKEVFQGYHNILSKYGFQEFTLYGPAHGTGSSEVEGLWLAEQSNFIIQPGMLFNIDIWLTDGTAGLRFEDGVLVTEDGLKELTCYRRESICL